MLPLILKSKNADILQALLSKDNFVFTTQDFASFIAVATQEKWLAGLKTFLWASGVQFAFTTVEEGEKKKLVSELIVGIEAITDAKVKRNFVQGVIEDTLSKKPYVKSLTLLLLEQAVPASLEKSKVVKECLKHLTGEDFFQLAASEP